MQLVVGLGNPGAEYERTLHNVGVLVVEVLAQRHAIPLTGERFSGRWASHQIFGGPVAWLLPQTYMNRSGHSVAACQQYLKIPTTHVLVIHDELDIPRGEVRCVIDRGANGHRGVTSIDQSLGTRAYWRLRVGVGRPEGRADAAEYVLAPVRGAAWDDLQRCVEHAADAVECFLTSGGPAVMQRYHGKNCLE